MIRDIFLCCTLEPPGTPRRSSFESKIDEVGSFPGMASRLGIITGSPGDITICSFRLISLRHCAVHAMIPSVILVVFRRLTEKHKPVQRCNSVQATSVLEALPNLVFRASNECSSPVSLSTTKYCVGILQLSPIIVFRKMISTES